MLGIYQYIDLAGESNHEQVILFLEGVIYLSSFLQTLLSIVLIAVGARNILDSRAQV